MADITQSDVSRPSALPNARLRPSASQSQSIVDQSSDEYLDLVEEEWNKKIDVEVDTLVDGMVDIVNLASIGDKDKFRIAQESFQAQCRAESMVRAAHSLLSITHSMKLLLLLSDESQIAQQRDLALNEARSDAKETKKKVEGLLNELLGTRERTTELIHDASSMEGLRTEATGVALCRSDAFAAPIRATTSGIVQEMRKDPCSRPDKMTLKRYP